MNKMQWQIIFIFVCFFFSIVCSQNYQKQTDGVLIELKKQKETDVQWVKIQICTEDIIRVLASQEKSFSIIPSLMVEKTIWEPVQWSVKEKGDWIEISTAKTIIKVHSRTGQIVFYGAQGKLLLQEKTSGNKIITQVEVLGEQTFHIQQQFESPQDEAFYGLGGHQNAIMNY
jgi:alpha-D-xyloside xylohydrolase